MKNIIKSYLPFFCGLLLLAGCDKDGHPLINPNTNDGLYYYKFPSTTDSVRVVRLGEQVWMQQDLAQGSSGNDFTKPYYHVVQNYPQFTYTDAQSVDAFYDEVSGGNQMFNWFAFMNEKENTSNVPDSLRNKGICPEGFHIPLDKEWTELENYLWRKRNNTYYIEKSGSVANALAVEWDNTTFGGAFIWPNCDYRGTPGCRLDTNNSTLFCAIPGGTVGIYGETSGRDGMGRMAVYATSSTPTVSATHHDTYYTRIIYYNDPKLYRGEMDKRRFAQVRCIKNDTNNLIRIQNE